MLFWKEKRDWSGAHTLTLILILYESHVHMVK